MMSRPASRVPRFYEKLARFASGLAVALAAITLAAVVAYWAWIAWGPKPVYFAPPSIESPSAVLRAAPLFGSAPTAPTGGSFENVVLLEGELRLLGLVAENEGQGYAVFRVGQGVFIAQAGDQVMEGMAGGVTLARVEPNAIVLREASGAERRVVLRPEEQSAERNEETPTAGVSSAALLADGASVVACVPAGFKGGVVRLNTELLQGALMQPETFYALLEARDGGLVVRSDNGHAAMLGLRAGDVLQSANGIALTRAEDVSATMLRPLTAGQSVLLRGRRGDQARELLLVNASVCRD